MIGKILIVDSKERNRELISQCLEKVSYLGVFSTHRGDTAAFLGKILLPDVIITDLYLKGLGGLEWCRRLRKSEQFEDALVMGIPEIFDTSEHSHALEAGFDLVLAKKDWGHLIPKIVKDFMLRKTINQSMAHGLTASSHT